MAESVDVSKLSLQQLSDVRKQLESEVDHLSESIDQLQLVVSKYISCSDSVKITSRSAREGQELLVPMTQSLYVPGKMTDSKSFIVDVGTNYFVEKSGEEATAFFDEKISTLNKNLVELERLLEQGVETLRKMDTAYKEKFREALAKADREG